MPDDTIFALSSGAPPAGVAVIRISGAAAGEALRALTRRRLPEARRTALRTIHDGVGEEVDQALVLWLPGPNTVTGEDMAEVHGHGGRAVVARILAVLGEQAGLRAAEAGEFTRRGFLNGRIDLLQAEGLADLLSAESEEQRRAASGMARGRFSAEVEQWRQALLRLAAQVEALLDFGDEDEVSVQPGDLARQADALAGTMEAALARPSAERLREGIRVVLGGPPNAGKSSLLNAIVRRDAAIVSTVAGTTRDVIEVPVAICGIPFLFHDTAGLHDAVEKVERIGIDRAREAIAGADLLLWLGEEAPPRTPALWLWARADARAGQAPAERTSVSARTGAGLDAVIDWLLDNARDLIPGATSGSISRRQADELRCAAEALREGATEHDLVLQAEAWRRALQALDRLTGRAGFQDLLDSVFGQFCLGK